VQTVFRSRALTDCGFENASAKCGLSRLESLSACSRFADMRVSIEAEQTHARIAECVVMERPLMADCVEKLSC
jgi:hypothetical protein